MTKNENLTFTHARIDGRVRSVWSDGSVLPPVIRGGDHGEEGRDGGGSGTDTGAGDSGYKPPASQAELDRIIAARIARVKAEPPADYAELVEAKKRLDAIEAENATELQKAQKAVESKDAEIATLKAELDSYKAKERADNARRQIESAAKDLVADPALVARLLIAENAVTIDDAGQVTDAETAVKALIEQSPNLAKTPGSTSFGAGGSGSADSTAGKGSAEAGRSRYKERHGIKS